MKKLLALWLLVITCIGMRAQSSNTIISFTVSMPQAASHLYHIVLHYEGVTKDSMEFKMPVWMPGYYQIMNYAQNVSNFSATGSAGNVLGWLKSSTNAWKVQTAGAGKVTIAYDVLSTRSFVATSYLDEDRGYLASPGVFMHPANMLNNPVTVTIEPYTNWKAVATGLATVKDKPYTFTAPNYDVLYDCPILMGKLDSLPAFTVKGIPHYFVAWHPREFDREAFTQDMQKIVTAASGIIGDIPYPFYIFLGLGNSPGGIEHMNSACVSFNGEGLKTAAGKLRMYSFLAHEYFHLYNVKRIRPIELGPFDYDHGNKTKMLWLSEGITVYYEYLVLRRAGLITDSTLLKLFSESITAYENKPGRWFQTPAAASYETWEDGPFGATGERANKTISPYDKGPLLGLLLDFKIRHETHNLYSFDDLMRLLYHKYYQQLNRGFTEDEFRAEAEKLAGTSLADFFDYIYTVKKVDYTTYLRYAGLQADTAKTASGTTAYTISPVAHPDVLQTTIIKGWYTGAQNQQNATIHIDATKKGAVVSPGLHGIFFEEISHGGDGGLYGELLQNRGFEDACLPLATHLDSGFIIPNRTPHFSLPNNGISDWKMEWPVKSQWPGWQLQPSSPANIQLAVTQDKPLNKVTPHALQVTILKASNKVTEGLVNEGFWGINVVKGDGYRLSFYACTNAAFNGSITASLQSNNGEVLTQHTFSAVRGSGWKKYTCQLKANNTNGQAKLVLSFGSTGTVWLDFVSLFPEKTFMHRDNGLRSDLAQYIADLHPAFVRWPGGCFVEGINVENTPNWKKSLGPVETRPATYSPWGYWCSNGFGYHEYLQFCEDIHAAALYVFNIGVSCDFRSGTYVPDEKVDSVIADILDGIEYAVGPVTSRWGRVRAANGHPAPFPLKYIEVGNEQSGPRYAARYNRFYKAIKAKYPNIQLVASMGIGDVNRYTLDSMKAVDIADEHAYKAAGWAMRHWDHFDRYKRGNWDLYVGEYATNAGVGNGNMSAALSDAVYIMSMERNADLVKMCSYAPLLVNVNDVDWPVNLINFDASRSFARISYYAIQLFNQNRADTNLAATVQIATPEITSNHFTGGIGLGTWDTQTEYKDITVTRNGKVAYSSDFINNSGEWGSLRGQWQVHDSALLQTAPGAQHLAVLNNKAFDTYTLTLKARKKEGYNAFIIPFAVKDSNTYLRAHIGSWVNSHCVFEKVTGGYEVSGLTDQIRLKHPIESNRWYTIRLEVLADSIACYLDDTLLMTYKEPATLFSIAGKSATGDIIVKMVNSGSTPVVTTLDITPSHHIGNEAVLETIAADSEEAENSFEHPQEYIPVKTVVSHASNYFALTLKPYSINVLRLRDN